MNRNVFKLIAIVAYLCIILKGAIIGMPLGLWLVFTVFDFGTADQLFALLAIVGLVMCIRNWNANHLLTDMLCFALLCLPLAGRLFAVPVEMFNYSAFIVPAAVFIVLYLASWVMGFSGGEKVE